MLRRHRSCRGGPFHTLRRVLSSVFIHGIDFECRRVSVCRGHLSLVLCRGRRTRSGSPAPAAPSLHSLIPSTIQVSCTPHHITTKIRRPRPRPIRPTPTRCYSRHYWPPRCCFLARMPPRRAGPRPPPRARPLPLVRMPSWWPGPGPPPPLFLLFARPPHHYAPAGLAPAPPAPAAAGGVRFMARAGQVACALCCGWGGTLLDFWVGLLIFWLRRRSLPAWGLSPRRAPARALLPRAVPVWGARVGVGRGARLRGRGGVVWGAIGVMEDQVGGQKKHCTWPGGCHAWVFHISACVRASWRPLDANRSLGVYGG